MRRECWQVFVLAVAASLLSQGLVVAQEAPRSGQDAGARPEVKAPDPARMRQLLAAWETRSAQLKSLDVNIARLDKSPAWGEEQYKGRAILKSPSYAWLDFQKLVPDEAAKPGKFIQHERIVCTGTEVWQYRSDSRQIFIFPLDRQNQKRALEEGPLPFLFNMKAAEAEARYTMDLVNETPDYWVVSVVPKLQVDRESFCKAFLKLNKSTFLPDRIYLVSPDGRSTKDFKLTSVKPNAPVAMENFVGKVLPAPWTVVRDPGGAGGNAAAPPRGQAAGVGSRAVQETPSSIPARRR